MEVLHRQKFGLAGGKPFACCSPLTLGAMPVAAAVIGDGLVSAGVVLAAQDMPAKTRRTAALDGAHRLQLAET